MFGCEWKMSKISLKILLLPSKTPERLWNAFIKEDDWERLNAWPLLGKHQKKVILCQ